VERCHGRLAFAHGWAAWA